MTSVEGLWCFMTSTLEDPSTLQYGGVVVLESGRALGGDSHQTYVGNYWLEAGKLSARIRTYSWHPEAGGENVFGMELPVDFWVTIAGERISETIIDGRIAPEGSPGMSLPIRLVLMHPLD